VTSDGRINGGLNLSRALGDWCYKLNDAIPLEAQAVSPLPDIVETQLQVPWACVGLR
jgi:protein phosphatase 1G